MTDVAVIAVDGGNSKTDLALVGADGDLLALVRGPLSSPHHVGASGALEVIDNLLGEALEKASVAYAPDGPIAEIAQLLMAGVDFPSEEEEFEAAAAACGWARRTVVGNDTFAVLRAGSERGWGVAVVCGAGINCVGVAPDGRHARFPALGWITGDWGGGYDVGIAAVTAAARSQDGRGPRTSLEQTVPRHFGVSTPLALAEAFHRGELPQRRVAELPRLVFQEAAHDAVAAAIVERVAMEVVTFARAAMSRLGLEHEPVEVVLGGGLLQSGDGRLTAAIETGLKEAGAAIAVRTALLPPVAGAALLGLDALGAPREAKERLREQMGAAAERVAEAEVV
jgi:N-acetylglucosamine kinase-like BadF-type ATPase